MLAGLALLREDFETRETSESIEAVFGTQYTFFRYDDPEANIDGGLLVLPSLTESGRVRSEFQLRSRYEIVDDLFFEVSTYFSYDSDADTETGSNSDYGVTTSLGYGSSCARSHRHGASRSVTFSTRPTTFSPLKATFAERRRKPIHECTLQA